MYLKKPFWNASSHSESQSQPESAVAELVNALDQQRLYREVTLALRTGLREARAEFSFLRVKGLRSILKFLRSVAESDSTINLFSNTQAIPDLQGRSILMPLFLNDWNSISIFFVWGRREEGSNLENVIVVANCNVD